MLISACEDVGMADPQALGVVESAAAAFERVGLPEGQFHLTQAVLYLATAPKSNSSLAFFDALKAVEQEFAQEVPNHLRDPSRDKHGFGHGEGYQYPHAYRDHWVAQQYLPRDLQGRIFYKPSSQGYEEEIASRVDRRRELQLEAALDGGGGSEEVLTFSPPDKSREGWLRRTAEAQAGNLKRLRDRIFEELPLQRHHRVLVCSGGSGFLVWEALRRVPEGGVFFLPRDPEKGNLLASLAGQMNRSEGPLILEKLPEPGEDLRFEALLCRQDLGHRENRQDYLTRLQRITAPGGQIVVSEIIPRLSTRLSSLVSPRIPGLFKTALESAEKALFEDPRRPLTGWTEEMLAEELRLSGYELISREMIPFTEKVRLSPAALERWLDPGQGGYGAEIKALLNPEDLARLVLLLNEDLCAREIPWERQILLLRGCLPRER
jgi:putative ATPase